MSTTTTNLGLIKPELTDVADITAMNENWDKIDADLMFSGYLTNGANIDTMLDGVYIYNGWASPNIICSAGFPFTNNWGIWIKKTPYNQNGGERIDIAFNGVTGAVYTMTGYNGKWNERYLPQDGSTPLGNQLYIKTDVGVMYIRPDEHGAYMYANQHGSGDVRYLHVANLAGSPNMDDALRLITFTNGAYRTDRVYHEGNKPTPADIGAVSRAEWEASLLVNASVEPKGV